MKRMKDGNYVATITVVLTENEADMVRTEAKEQKRRANDILIGCLTEGLMDLGARLADGDSYTAIYGVDDDER